MSIDLRTSPKSALGFPRVQLDPPEGSKLDLISINWCDRTTWYPNSVNVEDEVLTADGLYETYSPATERPWVDVYHGKLTDERDLHATYRVVVKVNDVVKTENSPDLEDEDFTIDYDTGKVTFNSALTDTDVVKATYHYATDSKWKIVPNSGRVIRVVAVELQFSTNVVMMGSILFTAYGLVDVFAPEMMGEPYNIPSGTKIPLESTVYQTMQDIINEASLAYPEIPKMGGDGWRGMKGPMQIFQWPWTERGSTDVFSKYGMELEVCIENDVEYEGDVAINTFYAISEVEHG